MVTDRYQLVHFYEPAFNYGELFDLEGDPHELQSVSDAPAYAQVRKELLATLARSRKTMNSCHTAKPAIS